MQKFSIAVALLSFAAAAAAQNPNCNGAPPAGSLQTLDPFTINYYTGTGTTSLNMFMDVDVQTPITINSIDTFTYDQGAGNPVVVSQLGNTATVNIWMCPVTRVGNEGLVPDPAAPTPSPWVQLGSGTITVTAYPATSPVVFATPVAMPQGVYGLCIEMEAVQAPQTNAAGLHTLIATPPVAGPTVAQDSFLTITNQGVQVTGWRDAVGNWVASAGAAAVYDVNCRLNYTPDPSAGLWTTLGEGCYFRPQGFYEDFPTSAAGPDLQNTSMQWIPLGANYLVVAGAATPITQPTSTSLTASAPNSASSTDPVTAALTWDDALSAPITLPFSFPFPGGSTNDITISSNGCIYLAAVVDNSYGVCGAAYGGLGGWQGNAPRIAPFYGDMDADPATGGGSIHYDVDPANQFVTITWYQVPEWPAVPGFNNNIELRLWATGQVDINYGMLTNQNTYSNNALVGFAEGLGKRLPAAQDLSASMPFQSGDGAIPPILGMDARPVIGTAPNIVTTNITPGTIGQVLIAGLTGLNTPTDLGPFGMPGCSQYINPFATLFNVLTPSNTFEQVFTIPNNPAFQNVQFFFQAAPLTSGLNSAGILTSNGVCAKIGL
ncbi:MAG: hypothetical protein H6838_07520 [Planctomycetes bacterium]|nr:hypothetical protein [Planctomycetota bacterium]MCB9885324.1 hypothetical protein [Planctomycetota bacterium]